MENCRNQNDVVFPQLTLSLAKIKLFSIEAMATSNSTYSWNVSDPSVIQKMKAAKHGVRFFSPIFKLHNLRWQVEIWPNGQSDKSEGKTQTFINLVSLPPSIRQITVRRTQELLGTDARTTTSRDLNKDRMYCPSWHESDAKTVRGFIMKKDHFVINVDIQILTMYDEENNEVSDQYLSVEESGQGTIGLPTKNFFNEQLQLMTAQLDSVLSKMEQFDTRIGEMENRMEGIQLRMDEEQKDGNMDQVMQEIATLKKQVKQLMLKEHMSPEQQKLKSWLENTVKMPDYFDVFIEGGIEDLETVSMLTKNELNDIGISKVGHQVKILGAAKKLPLHQNNEMVEGGTLLI